MILRLLLVTMVGVGATAAEKPSYVEARARFQTQLIRRGPAPNSSAAVVAPAGVRQVRYPSGELQLAAWVRVPEEAQTQPRPAVVYFHGGFTLDPIWVEWTQPFYEAGLVVMLPMLRGENGNPGAYELLLGEIDDAAQAVRWLADQPYVDASRIYTFGHSMGARVSLMLALLPEVPVRFGGGSAGLYTADGFRRWGNQAPFDVQDVSERRIRAPFDFLGDMHYRYLAYAGRQDYGSDFVVQLRQLSQGMRLEIHQVDGDHMGCLQPALATFLAAIRESSSTATPAFVAAPGLGSSWTMQVALGDLDGDGDLDIFEANYGTANRVWFNDGRGTFIASDQELGTAASHTVVLGDLDGDGDLDAFVGNVEDQPDTVWLNDGKGHFRLSDQRLSSKSTMGAALGDLDDDGDLDVVTGRFAAGAEVILNDGQGRFDATGQEFGTAFAPGIALGDVDADGDLDLVTGGWGGSEAPPVNSVWINVGKAHFELGQALDEPGRQVHTVATGDVDADGDADIVLGFGRPDHTAAFWLNEGGNRFVRGAELPGLGAVHGIALADIDADGDLDLALAQGSGADGTPNTLWLNDGKGRFHDTGVRLGCLLSCGIALGDLDGDGDLDIVSADNDLAVPTRAAPNGIWFQQASEANQSR